MKMSQIIDRYYFVNQPWVYPGISYSAIEDRLNDEPMTPAYLCVTILEKKTEKYLGPNDMRIKTMSIPNATSENIAQNELLHGFVHSGSIVRNNETTFGAGMYPTWRVDSTYRVTSSYGTDAGYSIVICSILGEKMIR